jgi:hypothetical protein
MKKPRPAPRATKRGTPVPMPKKTLKPGEGQRRPTGPITKKPMPAKTKKSGPVVVLPNGSTVGLRDIGKVKPTPKAVKPKPLPMTPNKEYFKRQKDYLDSLKKKKK